MKRFFAAIKGFFLPPATAPVLVRVLPLASIAVIMLLVFVLGIDIWEGTNAVSFCGLTCHTMPPQYTTHKVSAHANVSCEDCHMGRDVFGVMLPRKIKYSWQTGSAMVTGNYEYPIVAKNMIPARAACENCHKPETFTSDKLVSIIHFAEDEANTAESTYLAVKIGGGTTRQGLGLGIHWHIENPVYFYSTDREQQLIPYVVVTNSDGSKTEYVDIESGIDPASIKPEQLTQMDCITCHNRTAHGIPDPENAVDSMLSRGLISTEIPNIKKAAVAKLSAPYASEKEAMDGIATLADDYKSSYADFYTANAALVDAAVKALQDDYKVSFFTDQKMNWQTHPNNAGHINSPGCFRCHDGKHLTASGEGVRLECNLCHSIPLVAAPDQINANLELNQGFEPETHKNSNWISLHRTVFDDSCQGCHTTEDAGGTSNESFCSNPACHGTRFTFAGFDAPNLREILAKQAAEMVPPTPQPTPIPTEDPEGGVSPSMAPTPTPANAAPTGPATWDTVAPIFKARCGACHGTNAMKGLNLTSYQSAMAGGTDGPVIIPGDLENSRLVQIQSAAKKHNGQLTPAELEIVKQWILGGAAEK
jgi:hypothetical protein